MHIPKAIGILCAQLAILTAGAWGGDVTIVIHNGRILGETAVTAQNTTFSAFRGIPYAQPPVGDLRFNVSLPAKNWTRTYNATYERSICTSATNGTVIGTEDCLFLNVYSPKLPTVTEPNPKLPVIVWIHGGGYTAGSGNLYLHGADRFLNRQVLVVSINYRLGIFGFISTEDAAMPGNNGLKDQVLALRWVRDNIGYFGGDSNNVTIMGESAGGSSVSYLVLSKLADGLFQKAIAESGVTLVPWSQARCPRTLAFRVGLLNGIWTVNSTTLRDRLREINYAKLQQSTTLSALLDLVDPLNGLSWAPVIEAESDEAVLTGYCFSTLLAGNYSRVPLLLGFNSLEGRLAANLPWYGLLLLEPYNLFPSELTPKDMHATSWGAWKAGTKIRKYYFNDSFITPNADDLVNFITDDAFVRGIVKTAELTTLYADTYLYRFAFTGGILHSSFQPEGVSHAEELQFLWLSNTTVQTSPAAMLTSVRMIEMWTNFAKTGNPTPYTDENVNVTWPRVNATGGTDVHYLNIDTELEPRVNPEERQMDFWDDLYAEYGNPPYNTY